MVHVVCETVGCIECAYVIANGEFEGGVPDAVVAGINSLHDVYGNVHLVVSGGDPEEFSATACGVCGSHIAGARWEVSLLSS